ncbi:MAG: hypothetical protein ACREJD_15120 [Phycisphaerales bacterium]
MDAAWSEFRCGRNVNWNGAFGVASSEGDLSSGPLGFSRGALGETPVLPAAARSFEEIWAKLGDGPKADGRWQMSGAGEVLFWYWVLVAWRRRLPRRGEFDAFVPEWKGYFRSFRDLERVANESDRKRWGEECGMPLEGRVMATAPVNEQGVVLLFGQMAEELGFRVERVGTRYPDCVGWRLVNGIWKRVRIEFEFLSSRFDHDPSGCDLVVCWRHDWEGCPVEVLPLAERGKFSKGQRAK